MKKLFFLLFALLPALTLSAQPYDLVRLEAGTTAGTTAETTLAVDLEVRSEQVTSGPYARYAQKLLGVRPALSDRTTYTITGASISLLPADQTWPMAGELPAVARQTTTYEAQNADFARLPVDRFSATETTEQSAAQKAAEMIFSIRRHRLDLVNGEAGEHVFGAGLPAALERLDRMEQELLELFLGRRTVTTETHRLRVTPAENNYRQLVCRFSPEGGVVDANASEGDGVLLRFDPRPVTQTGVKPSSGTASYRVAALTRCSLVVGETEYDSRTLPIFQFGRTVTLPQPKR